MSKYLTILFVIAFFMFGFSIGMYLSFNEEKTIVEAKPDILKKSVQDVIINEIQESKDNTIEAIGGTIKISPYAKLTIEKHFTKCDHTTLDTIDVPKEIVNLSKEELEEKYDKWEIKVFESDNVHIFKEIDANCSAHFVLKNKDGYVAVYSDITDNIHELKETTYIEVSSMREEDQTKIKNGIKIYGEEELSSFIEDFNS